MNSRGLNWSNCIRSPASQTRIDIELARLVSWYGSYFTTRRPGPSRQRQRAGPYRGENSGPGKDDRGDTETQN
jgi:hypothetical protein